MHIELLAHKLGSRNILFLNIHSLFTRRYFKPHNFPTKYNELTIIIVSSDCNYYILEQIKICIIEIISLHNFLLTYSDSITFKNFILSTKMKTLKRK